MYKPSWLPAWHYVFICFVILVGTIVSTLTMDARIGLSRLDGLIDRYETTVPSSNRYDLFASAYQMAAAAAKDVPSASRLVGTGQNLIMRQDVVDRTIKSMVHVVETTPDEDGAWHDLAWLYGISGELSTAITAEQKAISICGNDYTYYVGLGGLLERSGRVEEAKSAYGYALRLYPRLLRSSFWHGLQARRPDLATSAIETAFNSLDQLQAKPTDLSEREIRARLDFETGRIAEAKEILRPINVALPNLSGMWELQGEIDESEHRIEEAVLDYKRASFLDPGDPLPDERLGVLDLRRGDADSAKAELLRAWSVVNRLKSPAAMRRLVQYGRIVSLRNGELPQALARETQPSFDFQFAFYSLAGELAAAGKADEAKEMRFMANRADNSKTQIRKSEAAR